MFAAALYPLLLGTLAPATPRFAPGLAIAAGAALALLVGAPRWSTCAATSPARPWPTSVFRLRRRTGGAQAQYSLARRHHPLGDVAAGLHAAAGGTGTKVSFKAANPGQ
jgi:hypothetical protein